MSIRSHLANITPLSLCDYKGIPSAVIYTTGCNMKCPWCHNGTLRDDSDENRIMFRDIESRILRSKLINGIVITGGEPSIHSGLREFIMLLKEHRPDLKIKLDTNAYNLKALGILNDNYVDNLSIDFKAPYHKYAEVTNMTHVKDFNKVMQTNLEKYLEYASWKPGKIEFRTTVIPQLTKEDIEEIKSIVEPLTGVKLKLQQYNEPE